MAGNGTIGIEIAEDLPDVDAVLVPFGGGGLVTGIATAIRALAPQREGLWLRGGDVDAAHRRARRRRARCRRSHAELRRRHRRPRRAS